MTPRFVLDDVDTRISRALSHHWATEITWGGEPRQACGHCAYGDGVHYLWPCPTVQALTGADAPDPLPQDPELRAITLARTAAT